MPLLDLPNLRLFHGAHRPDSGEMCLLEAAAYLAGEDWSDHPRCVCPVLGAFGRTLNDRLPDDKRQLLVPLIPELLGTRDDGHAQARAYMAADWAVHTVLPAFLALSDRITPEDVARVAALAPVTDAASARDANAVVGEIREKARTARREAFTALRAKYPAAAYAAAAYAAYAAAAYAADAYAADAADAAAAAAAYAAYAAAAYAAYAADADAAYAADAAAAYAAYAADADAAAAAAAYAAAAYAAAAAAYAAAAAAADAAAAAAYAADADAAADAAAADAAADADAAAYAAAAAAAAAARRAATEALAPTAARIQDSAIGLYTRMIRLGRTPAPETD